MQPGFVGALGPYDVLRELGVGGMGVVYLATRRPRVSTEPTATGLKTPASPALVAIKVLRSDLARSPRAVKRFLAEARHTRQFDHPHIVRVLDISTTGKRPYLVMPFLPAGSLATRLRRRGRPEAHVALRLTVQVAEALAHAHSKGIIHRDLSPANVLLDANGNACLTDFGLARTLFNDSIGHIDREHHEGTLPYMSPAVARGEAEDTRCDIYGVGALLYELLTGHPPYHGTPPAELRARILAEPPESIAALNALAPAALIRVAEHAMARELRQRYAHMADVVADLHRISRDLEPLGARTQRRPAPVQSQPLPHPQPSLLRRPGPQPARALVLLAASAVSLLALGFFLVLGHPPHPLPQRSAPRPRPASTPSGLATTINATALGDLDGDGHAEFLLVLPRPNGEAGGRLCCFAFSEAKLLWQQLVPWIPDKLHAFDLDGDGVLEILIRGAKADEAAGAPLAIIHADGRTRWLGQANDSDAPAGLLAVLDRLDLTDQPQVSAPTLSHRSPSPP